jgi:acetyl-CoA C-acetyltransferase
MPAREVMICTPVPTAIGTHGGSLKATPATALGGSAIKAVLDRSGLDPVDFR